MFMRYFDTPLYSARAPAHKPSKYVPILMNLARDLSDYFQFFGRKLHIVIFLALSKAFSAGLKAFP